MFGDLHCKMPYAACSSMYKQLIAALNIESIPQILQCGQRCQRSCCGFCMRNIAGLHSEMRCRGGHILRICFTVTGKVDHSKYLVAGFENGY